MHVGRLAIHNTIAYGMRAGKGAHPATDTRKRPPERKAVGDAVMAEGPLHNQRNETEGGTRI